VNDAIMLLPLQLSGIGGGGSLQTQFLASQIAAGLMDLQSSLQMRPDALKLVVLFDTLTPAVSRVRALAAQLEVQVHETASHMEFGSTALQSSLQIMVLLLNGFNSPLETFLPFMAQLTLFFAFAAGSLHSHLSVHMAAAFLQDTFLSHSSFPVTLPSPHMETLV
jgi:hypothetical protein